MKFPLPVKIALAIYFLALLLSIVGAIPNYIAASPRPPIVTTLAVWSVMYGILFGIGYAMSKAKNWARHLNAVFSIASVASVLTMGVSVNLITTFSQIIMLFNTVASVVVVILLYTKSSNAWFRTANET